ncbi:hypothetical protein, partial [Candidatus Nitrosotalea sp. FS]|uniref:hypothetical protein n=1 Tax=Candidatus Nitrosotalea sp. FS TaxID=2341021 RepID=UPI001C49AB5C
IILVAIVISAISLGFAISTMSILQTSILDQRTINNDQSQMIKILTSQLNSSQQAIENQHNVIVQLNNSITSISNESKSLEDRIASLENRVTSLEQRLQSNCEIPVGCPPPIPQKPVSFPGVVKFYNVAGGGGEIDNRVFKHLPSTLSSTGWSADFDYKFTASSMQRSWIFVLSATSDDPAKQDFAHIIMVEHGFNADQLMIDRSWTGPNATSSTGISISPDTQYYVRLQRAPTQLELSVFSDPARTINVKGSPVTLNILQSDYNNNLNFIQHDGCTPCGSGRTLTAEIDNTKIYETVEDATSIIFQDDYSSSAGWTQIGSSIAVNGTFVPTTQFYDNLITGRTG